MHWGRTDCKHNKQTMFLTTLAGGLLQEVQERMDEPTSRRQELLDMVEEQRRLRAAQKAKEAPKSQ